MLKKKKVYIFSLRFIIVEFFFFLNFRTLIILTTSPSCDHPPRHELKMQQTKPELVALETVSDEH